MPEPKYYHEASVNVCYRELGPDELAQPGEKSFLIGWRHYPSKSFGYRRYAILGDESHVLKLVNYWNGVSDARKYALIN